MGRGEKRAATGIPAALRAQMERNDYKPLREMIIKYYRYSENPDMNFMYEILFAGWKYGRITSYEFSQLKNLLALTDAKHKRRKHK